MCSNILRPTSLRHGTQSFLEFTEFKPKLLVMWMLLVSLKGGGSTGPDKFLTSRNIVKNSGQKFMWNEELQGDFLEQRVMPTRRKRSLPSAEETKLALDKHNYYRSIIGDEGEEPIPANMMYMSWDPSLTITALIYAKKCIFEHSQPSERSTPDFPGWNGENLWAGSGKFAGSNFNPEVGIKSWFMEYLDYEFDTDYCVPGKKCGHYTQVVWAESYKLGCAWVNCSTFDTTEGEIWNDAAYTVCHYAPGGNAEDEKLYKIGERCSQCYENDTCPDGRLCRNELRDAIRPAPTDAGHIFGILLCVAALLILLAVAIYFFYTRKKDFIKAWRERRRISSKDDTGTKTQDDNLNGTSGALPTMTQ